MSELEEIQAEIRNIDRDMTAADKRLERFRQAAVEIKKRNRNTLDALGLSPGEALADMLRKQGVYPEGLKMFRQALAEKGLKMPASVEKIVQAKAEAHSGEPAETPVKKRKRVKFRL